MRPTFLLLPILIWFCHGNSRAEFQLLIKQPQAGNTYSGDHLVVRAALLSTYAIQAVNARLEDRERDLNLGEYTEWSGIPEEKGYGITLPISGISPGRKRLVVKAVDIRGGDVSATVDFEYIIPPRLVIESPVQMQTASPTLQVKARCVHDPATTCSITYERALTGGLPDLKITRQGSVDTILNFRGLGEQFNSISFKACDGHNRCEEKVVKFYIQNSPYLTVLKALPKEVFTYRYGQAAFCDIFQFSGPAILENPGIWNSRDSSIRILKGPLPIGIYGIGLTPSGNVFLRASNSAGDRHPGSEIYQVTTDGAKKLFSNLSFNAWPNHPFQGEYAVMIADTKLWVKSAQSDRIDSMYSEEIPNCPGGVHCFYYLANMESGRVILKMQDSLFVYHNGTLKYTRFKFPLGHVANFLSHRADGDMVWVTTDKGSLRLRLDVSADTLVPVVGPSGFLPRGTDFRMREGWTAFYRTDISGQTNLWLLDPAGKEFQITSTAGSRALETVSGNGEVTYIEGGTRYWADFSGKTVAISNQHGNAFWEEGRWLLAQGNTLFHIHAQTPKGIVPAGRNVKSEVSKARLVLAGPGGRIRIPIQAGLGGRFRISLSDLQGRVGRVVFDGRLAAGGQTVEADFRGATGLRLASILRLGD